MSEKLCIDCKHCVKPTTGTRGYECRHPLTEKRDVVVGQRSWLLCYTVRMIENPASKSCGQAGRLWEPVYVEPVA